MWVTPGPAGQEDQPGSDRFVQQHLDAHRADLAASSNYPELWWRGEHGQQLREMAPTVVLLGLRSDEGDPAVDVEEFLVDQMAEDAIRGVVQQGAAGPTARAMSRVRSRDRPGQRPGTAG